MLPCLPACAPFLHRRAAESLPCPACTRQTASDAEVAEGTAKAIEGIEEYRARQLELHPQGIAVGIYVVSSGSVTIEREGELQVYTRGLQAGKPAVPSIRDIARAHPHVIPKEEINAHADPGVAIFNVEFDRVSFRLHFVQ